MYFKINQREFLNPDVNHFYTSKIGPYFKNLNKQLSDNDYKYMYQYDHK